MPLSTDIAAFLVSEYSDLERIYLIFQIDYKEVDYWDDFKVEADNDFLSNNKFTQNLFDQYHVDTRHQVLSPDLRKWLRRSLLGKTDTTWDQVVEMYESNGPGSDYVDPHRSFSVGHLVVDDSNGN
mmetsp:Transcript_18333/g.30568  ORF Transcript_18333/g.30568 Transcript_18333/m.30568 type:complete len:126 (+) Transcript_18333:63-440(+)